MKLAMSQLAWKQEEENQALEILQAHGFCGVEIAPTLVAGENPYQKPERAEEYAAWVKENFGFSVCSLQSIWFGKQGNLFEAERQELLDYTKQAIVFAQRAGAGNLVFGSPKNRVMPENACLEQAVSFFKELGDYAFLYNTVLALEANPPLYGTNFMNTTKEAFSVMEQVNSKGCRINLDFGTIIINNELVEELRGKIKEINHVHISEPQLVLIEKREEHRQLASLLREESYKGYISVEMKQQPLEEVERTAAYMAEVFA